MSVLEPVEIPQNLVLMTTAVGGLRMFERAERGTFRTLSWVNASLPRNPSDYIVAARVGFGVVDLAALIVVEVEEAESIAEFAGETV